MVQSSSRRRLPRSFFARDTRVVARDLLGRLLVRRLEGRSLVCRIVETEAYQGETDLACHAARGPTPRNRVLYGAPGTLYVYLNYGIHHLLNVVTERAGYPAAVLLRAAEPVAGLGAMRARRPGRPDHRLLSGPGNLTRALDVDRGLDDGMVGRCGLWFAEGLACPPAAVAATPRVGVDYARHCRDYPWRFLVVASPSVSGRRVAPGSGPADVAVGH